MNDWYQHSYKPPKEPKPVEPQPITKNKSKVEVDAALLHKLMHTDIPKWEPRRAKKGEFAYVRAKHDILCDLTYNLLQDYIIEHVEAGDDVLAHSARVLIGYLDERNKPLNSDDLWSSLHNRFGVRKRYPQLS